MIFQRFARSTGNDWSRSAFQVVPNGTFLLSRLERIAPNRWSDPFLCQERPDPREAKRSGMTLQEAADYLGIPKKRLWRAIKSGQLTAVKVQRGQRWEYRVTPDTLDPYRQILRTEDINWNDLEHVVPPGTDRSQGSWNDLERKTASGTTDPERSVPGNVPWNGSCQSSEERPGTRQDSPPAEVYIALIDRLSRAEKRSVELELQLRQSQRLLTENAESITEKEALAREAQAQLHVVEDANQAELERLAAETQRLAAELEQARHQLAEAQKPSGLFSWLGLRKKRTTSVSVDKAV